MSRGDLNSGRADQFQAQVLVNTRFNRPRGIYDQCVVLLCQLMQRIHPDDNLFQARWRHCPQQQAIKVDQIPWTGPEQRSCRSALLVRVASEFNSEFVEADGMDPMPISRRANQIIDVPTVGAFKNENVHSILPVKRRPQQVKSEFAASHHLTRRSTLQRHPGRAEQQPIDPIKIAVVFFENFDKRSAEFF